MEDPVNPIHQYRDPVPGLLQNLKNHEKHQKQSSKYYNLIVRAGFERGHVILFESHVLGPNNGLWGVGPKDVLTVLHLGITRESFKTLWKKRSVPAQQKRKDQNKDGPKGSYLMFNMHTGLPGGDFEAKDGGNYSFVEPAKHEEKSTITSQVFDPVTRAILQNFEANLIRALKTYFPGIQQEPAGPPGDPEVGDDPKPSDVAEGEGGPPSVQESDCYNQWGNHKDFSVQLGVFRTDKPGFQEGEQGHTDCVAAPFRAKFLADRGELESHLYRVGFTFHLPLDVQGMTLRVWLEGKDGNLIKKFIWIPFGTFLLLPASVRHSGIFGKVGNWRLFGVVTTTKTKWVDTTTDAAAFLDEESDPKEVTVDETTLKHFVYEKGTGDYKKSASNHALRGDSTTSPATILPEHVHLFAMFDTNLHLACKQVPNLPNSLIKDYFMNRTEGAEVHAARLQFFDLDETPFRFHLWEKTQEMGLVTKAYKDVKGRPFCELWKVYKAPRRPSSRVRDTKDAGKSEEDLLVERERREGHKVVAGQFQKKAMDFKKAKGLANDQQKKVEPLKTNSTLLPIEGVKTAKKSAKSEKGDVSDEDKGGWNGPSDSDQDSSGDSPPGSGPSSGSQQGTAKAWSV